MEYGFTVQVKVVLALTALHNFLQEETDGTEYRQWLEQIQEDEKTQEILAASGQYMGAGNLGDNGREVGVQDTGSVDMRKLRDQIAEDMWKDYCKYVLARRQSCWL